MDIENVTLSFMHEMGVQLITFYHNDLITSKYFQMWPGQIIPAPWHNTCSIPELMGRVDGCIQKRTSEEDKSKCHVIQGILTPDNGVIMKHFTSNLKTCLASKLSRTFVDWVSKQKPGIDGINIVTMDFVELDQFAKTVISLNWKLIS